MLKRKLCIGAFALGLPLYFVLKNRNAIYKGTKLVREFYVKELVARALMGSLLGVAVSIYIYGVGPVNN